MGSLLMIPGVVLTMWAGVQPWWAGPWVRWPLTGVYLGVLLLVSVYGLHRYWLVWLYYRSRRRVSRPRARYSQLPTVTVQLPMYNEPQVAWRVIDAACTLDYPPDRLQVQVLDDSTDGSDRLVLERVRYWADRGVDIDLLHRPNRSGYKAGALAQALQRTKGELVAIFDADFVPQPGFLKRTVHYFTDEQVGMVQTRWEHLNRGQSLLTRCQAIFLDGHFVVEHTARNRSSRWINFNGTAGVWRRAAIESAGGWQHDTLTEDVDLSYRAQLAGWRFVFLPRVTCPAELPPEINAFKAQQHRWTKGSIQTAIKLLPTLLAARAPLRVKVEAFFHLTSPMVYLYVSLMVLLFYPVCVLNLSGFTHDSVGLMVLGMSLFAMGTASAGVFYTVSQHEQRRGVLATLLQVPALMSIGIGIALNNARGCLEALIGHDSAFVRTPKYNRGSTARQGRGAAGRLGVSASGAGGISGGGGVIPTPSIKLWMGLVEIAMGLYTLQCARLSVHTRGGLVGLPFLALFATGYFYVGLSSLWSQWLSRRPFRRLATAP